MKYRITVKTMYERTFAIEADSENEAKEAIAHIAYMGDEVHEHPIDVSDAVHSISRSMTELDYWKAVKQQATNMT